MAYKLSRVDVWVVDMQNKPGMMARVLEALGNAGASLEFVVARRVSENTARAFVAPLRGARQMKAAADVGLVKARGMHCLRMDGPDKPGLGARLTRYLADHGVNLRGLSAAAIAKRCVTYIAFATEDDLKLAMRLAKKALSGR